jgi:hypothetical protein
MCVNIPEVGKRQPALGFPEGWSFFFEEMDAAANPEIHPDLLGLRLISSKGVRYQSVGAAVNCHQRVFENKLKELKKTFYQHIGASLLKEIDPHPLLGLGYCQEWVNVKGTKTAIYGSITKVEKDDVNEEEKSTVAYTDKSRNWVNSAHTGCGRLHVPKSRTIDGSAASGGCLQYLVMQRACTKKLLYQAPFYTKWLTPNLYQREMVRTRDLSEDTPQSTLPRLTITHGPFELTFTVKTSTIPNAGYGVFLSVEPLVKVADAPTHFELQPGELMDFGVCTPFQTEDMRSDHEFLIKNFIHRFKCEKYSFKTGEDGYNFDITDDCLTGKLHVDARRHIPPFVNEISSERHQVSTVHAMYDCAGAMHFLLGHAERANGPLRIEATGIEEEIFANYGDDYENVRLRKGYPRNPVEVSQAMEQLTKDEENYLHEIDTYTANEVQHTIEFFDSMLDFHRELDESVVERMVVMGILIKRRARFIMKEFRDLGDDESFCDNGVTEIDLPLMVVSCGKLLQRLCRRWDNDGALQSRMISVEIFLKTCSEVFTDHQVESITPSELRCLICDT